VILAPSSRVVCSEHPGASIPNQATCLRVLFLLGAETGGDLTLEQALLLRLTTLLIRFEDLQEWAVLQLLEKRLPELHGLVTVYCDTAMSQHDIHIAIADRRYVHFSAGPQWDKWYDSCEDRFLNALPPTFIGITYNLRLLWDRYRNESILNMQETLRVSPGRAIT
jgi:hypothetical protein